MKTRFLFLATVALTISLTGSAVRADGMSGDQVRQLVEQGEIQSLSALLSQHQKALSGRLIDIGLERHRQRWVYEIEILGEDGVVRELLIDARSGQQVGEEKDE